MKTKPDIVIFRKFRGGDILALFPEIPDCNNFCLSYQHVGQHGGADYSHCISITTPAKPSEYKELARELRRIGYLLDIRQRRPRRW